MSLRPIEASSSRKGRRGNTCLNCRRRKIKCDGNRPICGLCAQGSRQFEDCEYPSDIPTQTQRLEEKISQVKNRIRALEIPEQMQSLTLHHPYASEDSSHSPSQFPSASSTSSSGSVGPYSFPSPVSRNSPTLLSEDSSFLEHIQEPQPHLLNVFFSNSHQFGFFLDINRFYQSMMLPRPLGDYSRPSPALISAVYLWCSHLSSSSQEEQTLLQKSLYYLSIDLSGSHPRRIEHSIQAEVLISYYFLKNGKMLEGNHHADAASSLSLAAGFHRIRSTSSNLTLPPPADVIEEGERIDAFWAVLILNNYWAAIQESHSTFYGFQPDTVDTPWPMESSQYAFHLLPQESHGTLQRFLDGTSVAGFSEKALHAKASILLERATSIHAYEQTSTLQSDAFARLDSLIDTFKSSLPLLDQLDDVPSTKDRRIVAHLLAHAATIRLHLPLAREFDLSRQKSLYAAQAIVFLTTNTLAKDSLRLYVDPIIGIVWTSSCEIILPQILGRDDATPQEQSNLVVSFETILNQLTRFSEKNQLFKFLMLRVEKKCSVALDPPIN